MPRRLLIQREDAAKGDLSMLLRRGEDGVAISTLQATATGWSTAGRLIQASECWLARLSVVCRVAARVVSVSRGRQSYSSASTAQHHGPAARPSVSLKGWEAGWRSEDARARAVGAIKRQVHVGGIGYWQEPPLV